MPEIAEVRTVRRILNDRIKNKTIEGINIRYSKTIDDDVEHFKNIVEGKTINHVTNYGKWLIIDLGEYSILSHLRMEGKYFIKQKSDEIEKHEHVIFHFTDGSDLRYHDTRKFGRMKIYKTSEIYNSKELSKLGIEPDNELLTADYLYNSIHKIKKTIKETLLDQTIINGLGNIYVDEVLFSSKINPQRSSSKITKKECEAIVSSASDIIKKATKYGGTTIRSYTSSLGVKGEYQNFLQVHTKEKQQCNCCGEIILKTRVGGRGTYYCPKCQKK